jgi:hypothetical protein
MKHPRWCNKLNIHQCFQSQTKHNSDRSTNKMQQFHVYYLTFMCGSPCFGRHSAHHQGRTIALGASGFTDGAWLLVVVYQTTTKSAPTAKLQR